MTEYNEWFDEVSAEEYSRFVGGLMQVKPNHVKQIFVGNGYEWRLDGKLVAFSFYNDDGNSSITYCITNEDIVC